VCAMVSLRNVPYHMYFRCFARRCSTNVEFQCDERYVKYCLRYRLLASQSTLGLVDCGGRWAGDVNNAIAASESQLLARPRHASAGRRLITGREVL